MTKAITRIRPILHWLVLLSVVWFAVELIAFSGLELLDKLKGISYEPVRFELTEKNRKYVRKLISHRASTRVLSSTLGWTNKPNTKQKIKDASGNPMYSIRINSQGLRSKREYPLIPERDTVRILAFGDSFTFGSEVSEKDCWTQSLSTFAPQVEVINFGVPGFALDQALLRYEREGKHFNPRIVLMGFLTENIKRHVNVYRPFLYKEGLPAAKPRFRLDRESLVLLPNPLPSPAHYKELLKDESKVISSLGRFDHFYQMDFRQGRFDLLPSVRLFKVLRRNLRKNLGADAIQRNGQYNTGSEAYQVTVKLFERFAETVTGDGATPVAVIFPHGDDIKRFSQDRTKSYSSLLEHLDRCGIECVDLMDAFERAGRSHPPQHFLSPGAHYSPLGNLVVAHHLWQYLEARDLLD